MLASPADGRAAAQTATLTLRLHLSPAEVPYVRSLLDVATDRAIAQLDLHTESRAGCAPDRLQALIARFEPADLALRARLADLLAAPSTSVRVERVEYEDA